MYPVLSDKYPPPINPNNCDTIKTMHVATPLPPPCCMFMINSSVDVNQLNIYLPNPEISVADARYASLLIGWTSSIQQ
ncbi:hypothetical protein AX774_g3214 [Zancudomyces culisetae]|uniref:Uncharacterized protein n=1 Tax=Zancudomyces culisetae TaxID=1213189 RepID=A0A1R1PQP7_ZANCU|nr:hypothetical protein AX774_g3214 [Zancudomyces culisetae]|eukprot:OMH83287.1 hypothetical protein AX774_g3214 [Zancudomyces culisetae]